MAKEKAPEREQEGKDILTIRVSPKVNQYTKAKAEVLGISQNALINVLIDLGLRAYESEIGFIPQGQVK